MKMKTISLGLLFLIIGSHPSCSILYKFRGKSGGRSDSLTESLLSKTADGEMSEDMGMQPTSSSIVFPDVAVTGWSLAKLPRPSEQWWEENMETKEGRKRWLQPGNKKEIEYLPQLEEIPILNEVLQAYKQKKQDETIRALDAAVTFIHSVEDEPQVDVLAAYCLRLMAQICECGVAWKNVSRFSKYIRLKVPSYHKRVYLSFAQKPQNWVIRKLCTDLDKQLEDALKEIHDETTFLERCSSMLSKGWTNVISNLERDKGEGATHTPSGLDN